MRNGEGKTGVGTEEESEIEKTWNERIKGWQGSSVSHKAEGGKREGKRQKKGKGQSMVTVSTISQTFSCTRGCTMSPSELLCRI